MGVFVEAIAALVQALVCLVSLVLETMGFAVGHLAEKPKPGEARFSKKRLLVAFAPLCLLIVILPCALWYHNWQAEVRRNRIDSTLATAKRAATSIVKKLDNDGKAKWPPIVDLPSDAWGNQFKLTQKEALIHQIIIVRSSGPDETLDTFDDIVERRSIILKKKEIGKNMLDRAKNALLDLDAGNPD